ncbi:MAG: cobalamin biosynthesis protein, partial [Pseudonocardia sp.]|nr:cobalamin biosynthesis protein [Pseudonocardia sp.]
TAAGALGVRLGGLTCYSHGDERRPTLGDGAAPTPVDLRRAATLSRLLGCAAAVLATALAAVLADCGCGRGRGRGRCVPPRSGQKRALP